jgi:acyl-CoA thioesterase-1
MLGDSLTAGYGLRRGESLPAKLEAELGRLGQDVEVINAGVSGDTTADGLRRMDRDLPGGLELCVVALGANDMLQLLAPQSVRRNLDSILDWLERRRVPALLCGMRALPWFGVYAVAFDGVFTEVAKRRRVPLYPFVLDGIALDPRYALPDRLHPNAKGVEVVARRLAPAVDAALRAARQT